MIKQTFQIRKMAARDYEAVMALWRSSAGISFDEESDSRAGIVQFLRRNPGMSLVACDQGALVGAVLCGHDGRRGFLHHLAVAASHRKRGIGKALVDRCLLSLKKRHIPKCTIFLFSSNSSGKAFWQHNGWSVREDVSVMQKFL